MAGAGSLRRRSVLSAGAALGAVAAVGCPSLRAETPAGPIRRVRPGEAGWPTREDWRELSRAVNGRFSRARVPFADCAADGRACR